jgi:hypothetical protein
MDFPASFERYNSGWSAAVRIVVSWAFSSAAGKIRNRDRPKMKIKEMSFICFMLFCRVFQQINAVN